MKSVDKERNVLVALDRSSICVSTVFCHCGSWFCIGAAEVVLSIEGPLAMFCPTNLLQ